MLMPPRIRKFALVSHLTASVGWLGAVATFLALALSGLNGTDVLEVRAAYVAMDVTTRFVIWPLCLMALVTGVLQGVGTPWGLFQHYWVVAKLAITVVSTLLLALHTRPVSYLADVAAAQPVGPDLRRLRLQLTIDAGAAIAALLLATLLSIYKPLGVTAYGRRKQQPGIAHSQLDPSTTTVRFTLVIALLVIVIVAVMHLTGYRMGDH